jgi:hypothetical protein
MRLLLTLLLATLFSASGCGPSQRPLASAGVADEFARKWLTDAIETGDARCHGLGLLKHPEFSCEQMQTYAHRIQSTSRTLTAITEHDCVGNICGDIVEVNFSALDDSGAPVEESIVLKRDEGIIRMYLYRSNLMLKDYETAHPRREEEKDPVQVAYDELTARYPSLYQFPPCYGVRASSSNLTGALQPKDNVNVGLMETLATTCGESFCFGLVGDKIAPLCPDRS